MHIEWLRYLWLENRNLKAMGMGMIIIDLRPGNFEKSCVFSSIFIIFLTIVLGGKYRDKNTNYCSRHGITYIAITALKICVPISPFR